MVHPGESESDALRLDSPLPAADQDSAQGAQGRLAPVRPQLLPPLPSGRASRRAGRYVNQSRRVPMCHSRKERNMSADERREKTTARTVLKDRRLNRRSILLGGTTLVAASTAVGLGLRAQIAAAQAQQPAVPSGRRPNILVIMGDDIGYWNISAYSRGMMGYRTPNIDRIAREGAIFTDLYAQQSCTAGRAAFITGQSCFRTGLLKVGLPAAKEGLSDKDPTLADLLKPMGYATGQFGKNHLGDRNEFLPTVHGFDEFFGNLYHLNAENEPENPDYPKPAEYPHFANKYGPRGVLHSFATDVDDPTEDPRFGRVGKQKIEDTGHLTTKRMETVDEEFLNAAT